MPDFLKELRRRNVFRVGIAYLALAWVIIQVTAIAIPALNLPLSLSSIVFYLGLIGFPFAILFGWAFELTPDGLKRSSEVEASDSIRSDTGRQMERGIMGLLGVAVVILLVRVFAVPTPEPVTLVSEGYADTQPVSVQASIAVLPFVNMSDDKDYFSDGLSEEILNLLAKVPELKVTGRTSSFAFKGKNEDLRTIGAALGVSKVLEGSVRKSGDRIRITAQLINVEDGFHLWSETYDRDLIDIFAVQDEIAGAILDALKVKLGVAAPSRGFPTQNMEAYALYLEANVLRFNFRQWDKALDLLRQALALDPSFADAWEMLGQITTIQAGFTVESRAEALGYYKKALAAKPGQVFSSFYIDKNVGRGGVLQDLAFDLQNMKSFLEAQPGQTFVRLGYHARLLRVGHYQASLDLIDEGLIIDPLVSAYLFARSESLGAVGRLEEASEVAALSSERSGFYGLYNWYALRPLQRGDEAVAREYIDKYADATSTNAEDVLGYIRQLVEPDTRLEALDSPKRTEYFGRDQVGSVPMRILYLLGGDIFWQAFENFDSSSGDYYPHHDFVRWGDAWFLNDRRTRKVFEADGRHIDYWRQNKKPDFCYGGFESWICELKPLGAK